MGRFSKALIANIILEWQDGYIYYKFIKKSITKIRHKSSTPTPESQLQLLALLQTQLAQALSHFQTHRATYQSSFTTKIDQNSVLETQQLTKSLQNLISFSSWNLKILNKALTRIETIFPGSKNKFLNENLEILKDLRSLDFFDACEKSILKQVQMWKPAMEGLSEPLLTKTQTKEMIYLKELAEHTKDQLKALKTLELFPMKPDYPHFFTLLLMVVSSFIQQTNYYILALAAKDYSVYMGLSPTFSGILSFSTWVSIIVSSFVYNYWIFFQFKIPTVVCGLFMIVGNFTYYLAYDRRDFYLAIIGRVLIGIGGSRIINRKYIRTYVDKSVVSTWNYFYLAGSIVGRGVGPVLASSLYFIDYSTSYINGLTAPALLMCFLWTVYTALVFCCFQEPEKVIVRENNVAPTEDSVISSALVIFTFMVSKIAHEAHVISIPIIASAAFGWSIDFIGVYIAAISLAVAPIYIFIGFTRDIFEDRLFTKCALVLTLLGALLLVCYDDMIEIQYILGTFILYLGVNMDDGITGSLLTKFLPNSEIDHFINPGFLITIFGSLARGLGALSIPIAGWMNDEADSEDIEDIENFIFVPIACLCLLALGVVIGLYRLMAKSKSF